MSFLKAEWRKLVIANYVVDPAVLQQFVPHKTELDLWENKCYVSLVGFMFKNTKVLGMKIPWHINFEEVNLRFYVKHKHGDEWKRGVVFIRELVPRYAITFVANTFFNEKYKTVSMAHSWKTGNSLLGVEKSWNIGKRKHSIRVEALDSPCEIEVGCEADFITDHFWGYTRVSAGKTFEYEVKHPRWQSYPVKDHKIDIDFALTYGEHFRFLNNLQPASVMLFEGSEISVENKRRL